MKNKHYQLLKEREGKYFTETMSQAGRWLNYKILHVDPGYVEVSIHVRPDMTNPSGHIHGGMIAMICDELCGLSFYSLGHEHFYTTVSLNINYLFSAPLASDIIIKSRVIRSGKRMANVECYLYDSEERIIAHATSNLMNSGGKIFDLT